MTPSKAFERAPLKFRRKRRRRQKPQPSTTDYFSLVLRDSVVLDDERVSELSHTASDISIERPGALSASKWTRKKVRIAGAKSVLLRTLVAASGAKRQDTMSHQMEFEFAKLRYTDRTDAERTRLQSRCIRLDSLPVPQPMMFTKQELHDDHHHYGF
jgi:hypothetical protein